MMITAPCFFQRSRLPSNAMTCGCSMSSARTSSPTPPGAVWADTKLWAQNLKAWKKVAIVSDADWLENSVKAFGWLMPGEVKVFETDDLDDAKEWLAGLDDEDD
jgi:hypothetical protein